MNIDVSSWRLFSLPPQEDKDEEPGYRMRELLSEANQTHRDHFERRIEALPPPAEQQAPQLEAGASDAEPKPTARTWPRTIAVSLVLLTAAGAGTLITTIFNALINKSINDKVQQ